MVSFLYQLSCLKLLLLNLYVNNNSEKSLTVAQVQGLTPPFKKGDRGISVPDLYYLEVHIKNTLGYIQAESISQRNKDLIFRFHDEAVLNSLSLSAQIRRLRCALFLARILKKDFDKATQDDIQALIRHIDGNGYKVHTRYTYRLFVRQFFTWIGKDVSWISTKRPNLVPDEDLLDYADVKKMKARCKSLMERAMLILMFSSGARTSEILTLERRHIEVEKDRLRVVFNGKTGRRRIPVVMPRKWFRMFTEFLGCKDFSPTDRLFPLNYKQYSNVFKRVRRPVNKRVHPHLFRHSAATRMASYMTEAQLCVYFGWAIGSRTPRVYVHLSGRDLKDIMDRIIIIENKKYRNMIQQKEEWN